MTDPWLSISIVISAMVTSFAIMVTVLLFKRPSTKQVHYPHWNLPENLPPTECPIVINLGAAYDWDIAYGERIDHVARRGDDMNYRLSTGEVITGQFLWTYP